MKQLVCVQNDAFGEIEIRRNTSGTTLAMPNPDAETIAAAAETVRDEHPLTPSPEPASVESAATDESVSVA